MVRSNSFGFLFVYCAYLSGFLQKCEYYEFRILFIYLLLWLIYSIYLFVTNIYFSNTSYCSGQRRGWWTPVLSVFGGGFHHRVARRIPDKMPHWHAEGKREYPPLGDAVRADGIEKTETYISSWQDMLYSPHLCPRSWPPICIQA